MSHVFISYVHEDAPVVGYICEILKQNNVQYWIDKNDIQPGVRWKLAIRSAIGSGAIYLAMFSRNWAAREVTYANEELVVAIEELRKRPADRAWFIPVLLDDTVIPDREIGGGEMLSDLQAISFPAEGWSSALKKILTACGVEDPDLEVGEPLGSGLPPNVTITGGSLIYRGSEPVVPNFEGMVVGVTGGWATRTAENHILAYIQTQAPLAQLQDLNRQAGLDSFHALSTDGYISHDPSNPNTFSFSKEVVFPPNSKMWNMQTHEYIQIPFEITAETKYVAKGVFDDQRLLGEFLATIDFSLMGNTQTVKMWGEYEINVVPADGPPV